MRDIFRQVSMLAPLCVQWSSPFVVSEVLTCGIFLQVYLENYAMATQKMQSVSLKDVDQHKFVRAFSTFLKKSGKLKVPEWVDLVKNGKHKELAPYDQDWYYTRCSALLRHIYFRSPVGVGAVTKIFGGRKRNGVRPSHYCRSSGSVARKALQSLEALKLIEKVPEGRKLSVQGQRDIDRIAGQIRQKKKEKQLEFAASGGVTVVPTGATE